MKQQIEERIKVLEGQQNELAKNKQMFMHALREVEAKLTQNQGAIGELKSLIAELEPKQDEPELEAERKNKQDD